MSSTKLPTDETAYEKAVEDNKWIYDHWFDPAYAYSLSRNIGMQLDENYFRLRFIGFEEMPKRNNPERPLIFFGNHSGMAFPWDALMFGCGMARILGFEFDNTIRALVAPPLSRIRLMNAFLIPDFWRKCGGVDATTLNFETMMHYQEGNLLIYPEGIAGIGKGFNNRYQLQRFATSFVRMSLKHKTDIIPISTVNGEYINPHSYSFNWVNKLTQKIGIPFLPISWILLILPFCPWVFYFAFPARLTYVMGTRISPYKWTDKTADELSYGELRTITEKVRASFQKDLNEAVEEYGNNPFNGWSLIKHNLRNIKKFPFFNAPTWPILFIEHDRLFKEKKGKTFKMDTTFRSFLIALWHNPWTIAFLIPILGWIPILIKGYRSK